MKSIQILLPDHLHEQLQGKAREAGFDLSAYIQALLADAAAPKAAPPPAISPSLVREPLPPQRPATPVKFVHTPGGTKGPQSNMSVTIRWDLIGKGNTEAIRASTAAATLVHVISRLSRVLGGDTLDRLTHFRVSRGPLVSPNPGRDFVNGSTMETYGHHPLPGTDLYVLTHSSTDQKIKDLNALLTFLKLPAGLFEISKHRKS